MNAADEIQRLIDSAKNTLVYQRETLELTERDYHEAQANVATTEDKLRALESALAHLLGAKAEVSA